MDDFFQFIGLFSIEGFKYRYLDHIVNGRQLYEKSSEALLVTTSVDADSDISFLAFACCFNKNENNRS